MSTSRRSFDLIIVNDTKNPGTTHVEIGNNTTTTIPFADLTPGGAQKRNVVIDPSTMYLRVNTSMYTFPIPPTVKPGDTIVIDIGKGDPLRDSMLIPSTVAIPVTVNITPNGKPYYVSVSTDNESVKEWKGITEPVAETKLFLIRNNIKVATSFNPPDAPKTYEVNLVPFPSDINVIIGNGSNTVPIITRGGTVNLVDNISTTPTIPVVATTRSAGCSCQGAR